MPSTNCKDYRMLILPLFLVLLRVTASSAAPVKGLFLWLTVLYIISIKVQAILPYYEIMTPDQLYKHSTITKPFTVYPTYLEIPAGQANHERLIQA